MLPFTKIHTRTNSSSAKPLSVYDDNSADTFVWTKTEPSDAHKWIEGGVSVARTNLNSSLVALRDQLKYTTDSYFAFESGLRRAALKVHDPLEVVTLTKVSYVSIGALAGSVLSRNSTIIGKLAWPLLTGVAAVYWQFPNTSFNIFQAITKQLQQ
ncbi:hypothetical protein MP638_006213 [Amoeboaphelidium occidentale]|nr:hypothetical protein MP638_006213 [Amoeboaphelidium occidentale]